jgi:hypothetical protein
VGVGPWPQLWAWVFRVAGDPGSLRPCLLAERWSPLSS